MTLRFLLSLSVLLLAGCASVEIQREPTMDFTRVKTAHVVTRLGDDHRLDELIAAELRSLGLEVTYGHYTMRPDRVDVLIFYTDRWEWDFKSYLIQFDLKVLHGDSEKMLATVHYYRPSVISKTPQRMLHELLPPLFRSRAKPPAAPPAPVAKP